MNTYISAIWKKLRPNLCKNYTIDNKKIPDLIFEKSKTSPKAFFGAGVGSRAPI